LIRSDEAQRATGALLHRAFARFTTPSPHRLLMSLPFGLKMLHVYQIEGADYQVVPTIASNKAAGHSVFEAACAVEHGPFLPGEERCRLD
jgi:hypothetical protein